MTAPQNWRQNIFIRLLAARIAVNSARPNGVCLFWEISSKGVDFSHECSFDYLLVVLKGCDVMIDCCYWLVVRSAGSSWAPLLLLFLWPGCDDADDTSPLFKNLHCEMHVAPVNLWTFYWCNPLQHLLTENMTENREAAKFHPWLCCCSSVVKGDFYEAGLCCCDESDY